MITGSTDGIGLEAAKMFAASGHQILLHGRNSARLADAESVLKGMAVAGSTECFVADLSRIDEVKTLAEAVVNKHSTLDVLINNAGVFTAPDAITADGLDIRFAVNTIAPWLLVQRFLPILGNSGRVVNVSSAAQSPVDLKALTGEVRLSDMDAYAQSKLAITMWSRHLADTLGDNGPIVSAVNPGSMLGSKMVKEAFGVAGGDIRIGAEILGRAAVADEFAKASGQYFDNDSGKFAAPHADALDAEKNQQLVDTIEAVIAATT